MKYFSMTTKHPEHNGEITVTFDENKLLVKATYPDGNDVVLTDAMAVLLQDEINLFTYNNGINTHQHNLKTLKINRFGITLRYDENNKANATITTDRRDDDLPIHHPRNVSVIAIENMIKMHFAAGIDITTPSYLNTIEDMFSAIAKSFQSPSVNNNEATTIIYKERTLLTEVLETTTYIAKASDWDAALKDEFESDEQALNQLISQGKVSTAHVSKTTKQVNEVRNSVVF